MAIVVDGFDLGTAINGLISNFGVFGPAAWLGWRVIIWQRADLTKERDDARSDLKSATDRNNNLADTVITLAGSVEKTMAELAFAIRSGKS